MHFLDRRLAHAEGVDPALQSRRDQVFFDTNFTCVTERDEAVTVTLVGVDEAGMAEGKVSIGWSVALALLGAPVGDERQVRTPCGPEGIEVTTIRYPGQPPGRVSAE